jgi:plasmid stabilization system protein ParE
MSFPVVYSPEAALEYKAAIIWYKERSLAAAEGFVIAVDNAINLICENPQRWKKTYKNFYELGIKKYPYQVIYFFDQISQKVIIAAVFHTRRNPRLKNRRKPKYHIRSSPVSEAHLQGQHKILSESLPLFHFGP